MLALTVTIEGRQQGDLMLALDEVRRLVDEDYLCGNNSNDTGSFSFDIAGEEEPDEADEEAA